jgi:hypothetical protein
MKLTPMVNPFSYSQSIINALERALSPERLSTYLAAAHGDHAARCGRPINGPV